MTDQLLIQAFLQGGKTEAINQLLNKYQGYILSICMKYSSDMEDAKDNVQDILIKVYEKINSYNSSAKFSTWLYSIARNHCYDQVSKKKKNVQCDRLKEEYEDLIEEMFDDNEFNQNDKLKSTLKLLSVEELTLLNLKYKEKKSIDDISNLTGLSISCIKMRLSRAKLKARALAA